MPRNYQLSRNCSITISFLLYFIALWFRLCAYKVIYIPEVRLARCCAVGFYVKIGLFLNAVS